MSIAIGNRRELFLDDYLIDKKRTTAGERLNRPVRRECIMTNNAPWEANGWIYYTVFEDDGIFRMYYICFPMYNKAHTAHEPYFYHICYAESKDGVEWVKPNLGLHEVDGSKDNNIVYMSKTMDAFHVFKDKNPNCPPNERYKGVYTEKEALWCGVSSDGLHFQPKCMITDQGRFDSYNSVFWDEEQECYVCYMRDFHEGKEGELVRDVRCLKSKDFVTWSDPKRIEYNNPEYDFQMYTNGIQPYFRAPHIYVGFPTRYTERQEWSPNYDRLCGAEHRKWRMTIGRRYGLAVTDGLFMSSRDGHNFRRWSEAFMRPGPESKLRWIYGDGYLAYGMLETDTNVEGEDKELSFYASANAWSEERIQVFRYTLRMDGFVCRYANYEGGELVTKPFTFKGEQLYINFATSAAGCVRIVLEDEDGNVLEGYDSGELFGDSTDRIVDFERDIAELSSKVIRMRIELQDAEIYSFQFR